MSKREERRQELLDELARRFHDSADTLRAIARRIEDAGKATLETRQRIGSVNGALRADLDASGETVPFTYREYLEFSSADEFRRFSSAGIVTDDDLKSVDWERLIDRLLGSDEACSA